MFSPVAFATARGPTQVVAAGPLEVALQTVPEVEPQARRTLSPAVRLASPSLRLSVALGAPWLGPPLESWAQAPFVSAHCASRLPLTSIWTLEPLNSGI